MPTQPQGSAVEPLCEAVDGAVWVRYDKRHRLLFVGRVSWEAGFVVHSYDVLTGEPHDSPWPLDPEVVERLGVTKAFAAAVAERVNRGY
jgi:hypothetical protein